MKEQNFTDLQILTELREIKVALQSIDSTLKCMSEPVVINNSSPNSMSGKEMYRKIKKDCDTYHQAM